MGRTACGEPHCLYKGALNPLTLDVVISRSQLHASLRILHALTILEHIFF